jgi:hypothetical protein
MSPQLAAVRVHSVAVPAKLICSRAKRAWLLSTAPVRRWHSKQWHMEMRTGSPSIVRWNWPQLQAARRVVMGLLRLRVLLTMPRAQGYRKPIADQSALMPANFTTLAHFSVSSAM